jgi:hypothetical protein
MTTRKQTPIKLVRERGYRALMKELEPVDYIRFLRDLGVGTGDYTRERHRWLDEITPANLNRIISKRRKTG